ncbi:MAG TPA: CBS domain-containing protein [Terriglobales bacterium]|nr:CBS domain-containing protein [Terriglobales bacterium]
MKVRDVMAQHPVCCRLTDTAQTVAQILRDEDIGSLPVISEADSERLAGIITDRDLCCRILAAGLDPKTTSIEAYVTRDLVTCRPEQSLDSCAKLMELHQIRRVLIVDRDARCVGILSQADLARSDPSDRMRRTVAEISKPSQTIIAAPTAA